MLSGDFEGIHAQAALQVDVRLKFLFMARIKPV